MKTANLNEDVLVPAAERAGCQITPNGTLAWTAFQSGVTLPITYSGCAWQIDGRRVVEHKDLGMGSSLGLQLRHALNQRRVELVAEKLGCRWKASDWQTGSIFFLVDSEDDNACVEMRFLDGFLRTGVSRQRVRNLYVASLAKLMRPKLENAREEASARRQEASVENEERKAKNAFIESLRAQGWRSDEQRTLCVSGTRKTTTGWQFQVTFTRLDGSLAAVLWTTPEQASAKIQALCAV